MLLRGGFRSAGKIAGFRIGMEIRIVDNTRVGAIELKFQFELPEQLGLGKKLHLAGA